MTIGSMFQTIIDLCEKLSVLYQKNNEFELAKFYKNASIGYKTKRENLSLEVLEVTI